MTRPGSRGTAPLRDDERLRVALPGYLALVGADFEEVAGQGKEVAAPVVEALVRFMSHLPPLADVEGCAASLQSWSKFRCSSAFGTAACPVTHPRARAACLPLPLITAKHDGRIQMLP